MCALFCLSAEIRGVNQWFSFARFYLGSQIWPLVIYAWLYLGSETLGANQWLFIYAWFYIGYEVLRANQWISFLDFV